MYTLDNRLVFAAVPCVSYPYFNPISLYPRSGPPITVMVKRTAKTLTALLACPHIVTGGDEPRVTAKRDGRIPLFLWNV